jgi:predicted transcriptional regulator of viral defense system
MEILVKIRNMHQILSFAQTSYIETQNILPLLAEYTNPRACISRLVKKGELIRLKNGFFVIAEKIKNIPVPYEQIGNLLYGPSYISFEWALSHYGMIPEGVYVVTSASASKSKSYKTPLGTFEYISLSHSRYAIGIDQKENSAGKFLIATPEKALADLVHLKSKKLNAKDLLVDLIEARRIDEDNLKNLNKKHMSEIAENYRSKAVMKLVNALGML